MVPVSPSTVVHRPAEHVDSPVPRVQSLRSLWAEGLGAALFTLTTLTGGWLADQALLPVLVADTVVPGLSLLLLIYALSDVSGVHINPAMTLAFALRGCFPWRRVVGYCAAQVIGAFSAARLLSLFITLPHAPERVGPGAAFSLEVVATVVLVTVVLATADRKASIGTQSAIAVAGTLSLCHLLTNPLMATSLNPARVLGVYLTDGHPGVWPHLWGPLVGATLAVGLTWLLRGRMLPEAAQAAQGDLNT